jgi:hypothetical protein
MEKILGIIYLTVVFLLSVIYLFYYIAIAMDRYKSLKKKEPKPEPPPESANDIVGKSTTVFLAPLHEPVMSIVLEYEMEQTVETEPDISPTDVEIIMNRTDLPDKDEFIDYFKKHGYKRQFVPRLDI